MQNKVFPLNLALNKAECLKFVYEAPNGIALNRTMQRQAKAYIAKSSCKISTFPRY